MGVVVVRQRRARRERGGVAKPAPRRCRARPRPVRVAMSGRTATRASAGANGGRCVHSVVWWLTRVRRP